MKRTQTSFSTVPSVHNTEYPRRLKGVKLTKETGFSLRMTDGSPLIYVFVDQNWVNIIIVILILIRC